MKIAKKILIILFIIVGLSFQQKDRFVGKIIAEWLDDGRKMKLLKDFSYIDPAGKTWKAPAGSVVDGASIPKSFWCIIGGPYEENYRMASVVHDYYCEKPYTEKWEDVHKMFYNACITGGVTEIKAKLMYGAVLAGGPRWEINSDKKIGNKSKYISIKVTTAQDKFEGIARWIEQKNPEIQKIADTLNTVVQEIDIAKN
ncbi:DUF1353 domain-containing protein [Flavobacterium tructae]|uniref:DUF1353 domain-containing protein n=1 Tax=Flavobacterium tructae TaxID=1114873 RepID=UPI002551E3D8|nr:DUF1353 domain-containing protein [Flavobacterium tructae]MDL2141694.1 DUF1353 domain-containing protein [Flavobacterium tructae]